MLIEMVGKVLKQSSVYFAQLLSNKKYLFLFRNNTCPECRSKTTKSTVMRLYVNVIDRNPDDNINGDTDFLYIQNENDNLKFRLIEKDGALKSKEEALDRLRDENQKLSNEQVKARKIILALEEKNETNGIVIKTHNEQVCIFQIETNRKIFRLIKFISIFFK